MTDRRTTLRAALAVAALLAAPLRPARATTNAAPVPLPQLLSLVDGAPPESLRLLERVAATWQDPYAAPLLEALTLTEYRATVQAIAALMQKTSGLPFDGSLDAWFQWAWALPYGQRPGYAQFKAGLYERIDPRFREYFAENRPALIRLDEIRWGGVRRDGIPPLKNPKMIDAAQATYLADDNVVFGVAINGDVRAYPKRILAWHEMVKDRIGGLELNGVYCTLCGSMVLYDVTVAGTVYELGTSGFLYRSNKLMYDHATQSLWSTLTGTPVVGPLVGRGIELKTLYVVTTTWGEWRRRHPGTRVLSLDTGHRRDYGEGVAYAEYFGTDSLMFTVPKLDARLANKAEVLALRATRPREEQLAIAADFLRRQPVYHDRIGSERFIVLTDASGANRVYASGNREFARYDGAGNAVDSTGAVWRVGEAELLGPDGTRLARLPAHRAFWFGWVAQFPTTRLVK